PPSLLFLVFPVYPIFRQAETAWASAQAVLYLAEEAAGVLQIPLVRVSLSNSAHQLEGAKGIVALAAELPQNGAVLLPGDLRKGLGAVALGSAVGVDKEHRLALGQVLTGKFHHSLLNVKAVDAGGKADTVIVLQPDGLAGGHINEVHLA